MALSTIETSRIKSALNVPEGYINRPPRGLN